MSGFARALTELRRKRGMTQKSLAEKIGKSTAYISALESEAAVERCPSVETLRDIVHALSSDVSDSSRIDPRFALPLISQVLNLNLDFAPSEIEAEALYTTAFTSAKEIWIVSSDFEEVSRDFVDEVVEKIKRDKAKIVLIVPFSLPSWHLRSFVSMLQHLGLDGDELQRVKVFRASECAFSVSFQVCDPLTNPQGFYLLGSDTSSSGRPIIRQMPTSGCLRSVEVYGRLCSMFIRQTRLGIGGDDPVGDEENGHLKIVYPKNAQSLDERLGRDSRASYPLAHGTVGA